MTTRSDATQQQNQMAHSNLVLSDNLKEVARKFVQDANFRSSLAVNVEKAISEAGLSCTVEELATLKLFLFTIPLTQAPQNSFWDIFNPDQGWIYIPQ